jgi:DNA-binding transcriptional ArsR family regulator
MTPEVARREVARARAKGLYSATWHHKPGPTQLVVSVPDPASKTRRLSIDPMRRDILRAIANGHATITDIAAALDTTPTKVSHPLRRMRKKAPWAFETIDGGGFHANRYTLTERGRELIGGEG